MEPAGSAGSAGPDGADGQDHALRPVRYPMGVASERTGIPATVLRSWEARYRAVVPERTAGGHRLYSDEDLRRLELLRTLVDRDHRISQIARLPDATLETMVGGAGEGGATLAGIQEAVRAMDARRVDTELRRAALDLGADELVDEVLLPLLRLYGPAGTPTVDAPERYVARRGLEALMRWRLAATEGPGELGTVVVRPVIGDGGSGAALGELAAGLVAVLAAQSRWGIRLLELELQAHELRAAVRALAPRIVIVVGVRYLFAALGESPGASVFPDAASGTAAGEMRTEGRAAWREAGLLDGLDVARWILADAFDAGGAGPGAGEEPGHRTSCRIGTLRELRSRLEETRVP